MNIYELFLKKIIFSIDPEKAHRIAINFIKNNFLFDYTLSDYLKPYLSQEIFGIEFSSPIGISAGFDKNCELYSSAHKFGFGFLESGTVTIHPQKGNPKPRVFRIPENNALINSLGFNNDGIEKFIHNATFSKERKIPVGINIGPNKDSEDFMNDYKILIEKILIDHRALFDYITINISSPNTKGLRDLNQYDLLNHISHLIHNLISENKIKPNIMPIFIKISPDIDSGLNDEYLDDMISDILKHKDIIKGIIISNTTTDRIGINEKYHGLKGGLSGKPLFEKSTQLLKKISQKIYKENKINHKEFIIIGSGGIFCAEDLYKKIKLGASLAGLYTVMIYKGPFYINQMNRELVRLLQDDGFSNISDAICYDI